MLFVEDQSCLVVHRRFQKNAAALDGSEAILSRAEQLGADPEAASGRQHIDGEYVAGTTAAGFRDKET